MKEWFAAKDTQELREVLLRHERFICLTLASGTPSADLLGQAIRELSEKLPASALIALIHRDGEVLIPHGDTVLREGDRLTIIGNPKDIRELYDRYAKGE